jgi:hypothetical protein
MPIDASAPLLRSSQVIATEVDGEIVLMSIEDGKYFGLDAIGSEIWRRLEAPKTAGALIAELTDHFEGDAAVIERETQVFLDKLADSELLTTA